MKSTRPLVETSRILFHLAAGPRIGSGHLVRATRLAALVGIDAVFSVRGAVHALRVPGRRAQLAKPGRPVDVIEAVQPSVIVVDDPSAIHAAAWVAAARAAGRPVVAFADAGVGAREADVLIDGSVAAARSSARRGGVLSGPDYAVVDPAVERAPRLEATRPRVFISLGGGVRTAYAVRLADTLAAARPDVRVVVAGGFVASVPRTHPGTVTWLGPQRSLVPWLASATVAIVAGGITLYEACALGVPSIAVAVVQGQRPAVEAMAARGAVWRSGKSSRLPPPSPDVARLALELLGSAKAQGRLRARAASTVDGRGASRVAQILQRLAGQRMAGEGAGTRSEAA